MKVACEHNIRSKCFHAHRSASLAAEFETPLGVGLQVAFLFHDLLMPVIE